MIIRRMQEKDLIDVTKIEQVIFSDPWSLEDFQMAVNDKKQVYLVAERESEILAYCGFRSVLDEAQILNVAVDIKYRRQGIAKLMLASLIKEGLEAGQKEFTLEVRSGNLNAIILYEKFGFHEVGVRKNFYTMPMEDAILMTAIPTIHPDTKMIKYNCGGIKYGTEDGGAIHEVL